MYANYKLKEQEKFIGAASIIKSTKECRVCGKRWHRLPAYTIENEMGFWWNCACKSTLVEIKKENVYG